MKKTILGVVIAVAAVLSVIILLIMGIRHIQSVSYRKQVVDAIRNHDLTTVESLVNQSEFTLDGSYVYWYESEGDALYHRTPLQFACYIGDVKVVKTLLEHGADVNYVYWRENPCSPLMEIARTKQPENRLKLVDLLLEYGANLDRKNYNGETVLDYLMYKPYELEKDVAVFLYLESKGADVSAENNERLLFRATISDNVAMLKFLVDEEGYDINALNVEGRTPLIEYCYASNSKNDRMKTINTLLELNADKSIKDDQGKTAYDYALEYGYEFAELLKP